MGKKVRELIKIYLMKYIMMKKIKILQSTQ